MGRSSRGVHSIVSTGFQFKKPSTAASQEPKSFIETIREDFRNDTDTWFGTEAVSSESGSMSVSTDTEMHGLGSEGEDLEYGNGTERRRRGRKNEMEHTVRILSGQGYSVDGEDSHLDLDP